LAPWPLLGLFGVVDAKNGSKTIDGTEYYKQTNVGLEILHNLMVKQPQE
jgi:hypothetical protein